MAVKDCNKRMMFTMHEDTLEALQEISKKEHRSISAQVNYIVEKFIEKYESGSFDIDSEDYSITINKNGNEKTFKLTELN